MKKRIMSHLKIIYVYCTIIIIATSIFNLILGHKTMSTAWCLQLFLFLVLFNVLDFLLEPIDFKKYSHYVLTESAIAYLLFLGVSYAFHWFPFTPKQIIYVTIVFIIIVIAGSSYFYQNNKMQSEELNALIQKKQL